MAVPANVPLTIVRGDAETITLIITTDGTTAVNITGRTYLLSVAATAGGTVVVSASGSVVGATGTVTFTLSTANTTLLTASSYLYEIVETASSLPSTLILADMRILAAVTA